MGDMGSIDWNSLESAGSADGLGQAASTYGIDGSGGFYDFGSNPDFSVNPLDGGSWDGGTPAMGMPEPPVLAPDTSFYQIPTIMDNPKVDANNPTFSSPVLLTGDPTGWADDPLSLDQPSYSGRSSGGYRPANSPAGFGLGALGNMLGSAAGSLIRATNGPQATYPYQMPTNQRGYSTVGAKLPVPLPGQTLLGATLPGGISTGLIALIVGALILIMLARR